MPHPATKSQHCYSASPSDLGRFCIFGIEISGNFHGGMVSVRSNLLVILTIGPAYGFQLHGELQSRTAGRRTVNVGQIYGTLDRLVSQGAVESAGTTHDGLPLYRLTDAGRAEALTWLSDTSSPVGEEWNDLVDRVLLASSLPHSDVPAIIAGYRSRWQRTRNGAGLTGQDRLAASAASALAAAALAWLDEAEAALAGVSAGAFRRELSHARPRRGRRPAAAVPAH
ncbi:PadR family transcriptional regulator [Cryobacterium sp. TMT1-2-1]|nr:PadR family transcriptional regulator [Cryobacterium sp. TMT1-2-1]